MAEQGGLLSFLNSPTGMGLLSAVGAGLAGARRGQPINALGMGLMSGVQGYNQAQETQAIADARRQQADWLKTQRDWMTKDRERMDAERMQRENWLRQATAPQPILQPSAAPQSLKDVNPYTDPSFIYGTAKLNNLPGVEKTPMGVPQINPLDAMRNKYSAEEAMQLYSITAPKKPNIQTFKPGDVVRNMDTGELVFQAPEKPAEAPSAVREYEFARGQGFKGSFQDWVMSQKRAGAPSVAVNMSDPTAVAKAALSFQNDYRNATKSSFARASAYNAMIEAMKDPTPKGDMAMVYSYIKALDPDSVVREGEIDLVNANRSIPDRIKGYAQRLATGKSLLPSERQDLLEQARNLSFTDYNRSRNDIRAFRDNAARLGLDPELYAPDPYQGVDFGPRKLGGGGGGQQAAPVVRKYNPATGRIE